VSDRLVILHYDNDKPQRLDKFLVASLPEFSRSRLQTWIRTGKVTVDGKQAQKSGQALEDQAVVKVLIPPTQSSELTPEAIPLDVVFENEDLLVVNKPAGMVVHPAAGHSTGTLVHAALAHAPDISGVGGEQRPGVVHRLDKQTSGLILLAKNDTAHQWLQNQFRSRQVDKVYLALVDGAPPTPRGRIEAAIGRDTKQRMRMAVVPPGKGRQAITEFFTRQAYEHHAFLEIHPLTGRTHQIRVHLAYLGCPIVGDTLYGRRHPSISIDRHFLHAYRLTLQLSGKTIPQTFEARLPDHLEQILAKLTATV